MSSSPYELFPRFAALFDGLKTAYGTGEGRWVKRPLRPEDWVSHLQGLGPGIGVAPLRPDNTVKFAAIDLDEPDFDAAREMQGYLPGTSFIEKSRSGNAHVWVFFREPLEAWVAMGILKEATLAAGKMHVEVFPKNHDFARVKLGNYINLPYHGIRRPILNRPYDIINDLDDDPRDRWRDYAVGFFNVGSEIAPDKPSGVLLSDHVGMQPRPLEKFLDAAEESLNDPEEWRKKARWLLISPPEERERRAEFGTQKSLHICANHIIEHAEDNPVREGHRASVYFALAKQLTNWEHVDHEETLEILRSVNEASPDRISDRELLRILGNAERGGFTSTGCDDPLFAPYAHPDCPIANPRSR